MHTLRENMPRVFASIEGITLHESIIMHLESKYSLVDIHPPRNTVDPKDLRVPPSPVLEPVQVEHKRVLSLNP